jgi:hypothetical protein
VLKRLRPLLLGCAGMLVVVASLWYRTGDPATGDVEVYAAHIRTCADGPAPKSREEGLRIRDCISVVLGDAYDATAIGVVASELEELTEGNALLRNSCHTAVHYFMEQHVVTEEGLWRMLDETGATADCDWAFGMAAIVGLAALGPQEYVRGEILAWCNATNSGPRVYGNCLHAIGHHAWKATASVAETVGACEEVPEVNRGSCASGALMEMFEPSSQTGATYERSSAPAVLPGLCTQWREFVASGNDTSCEHGAGYVYGLDVRDAGFALLRDKELTSGDIESAAGTLRTAIRHCRALRDAPSVPCETMLVNGMPGDLVSRLPEVFVEFCAVFTAGPPRDACDRRAGTPVDS